MLVIGKLWNLIATAYNAGGASMRWIMWFWVAIGCLYMLLSIYDHMHEHIPKRELKKKNNYYTLLLFLFIFIGITYGHLIANLPTYYPFAENENSIYAIEGVGFVVLIVGTFFITYGRLSIDGYWARHICHYIENPKLITKYAYNWCRHPIYFGQILMGFGSTFTVNNWLILPWAIALLIMNVYRARQEEKELEAIFQDEWRIYKEKIKFILPLG